MEEKKYLTKSFCNFPLMFPPHSSAEQHDDVSWSRLHASPPEQHAAQSSGHQHRQHPQRERESQQQRKKRKTICRVLWCLNELNIRVCVSQMSPFSMNGMPSPGYQCPTSVYQPTPQQVYSLTQTGQQVLNSELLIRNHSSSGLTNAVEALLTSWGATVTVFSRFSYWLLNLNLPRSCESFLMGGWSLKVHHVRVLDYKIKSQILNRLGEKK